MTKTQLIEALNRMKELAGICAGDMDSGNNDKKEVKQLIKDYHLLFSFIKSTRTAPLKKITKEQKWKF